MQHQHKGYFFALLLVSFSSFAYYYLAVAKTSPVPIVVPANNSILCPDPLPAVVHHSITSKMARQAVEVSGTSFSLNSPNLSYRFHVSQALPVPEGAPIPKGELVHDHFGSPASEDVDNFDMIIATHETKLNRIQREFSDLGRGDFRLPGVHIRYPAGHYVSHFEYESHEVKAGKEALEGLPSTWGKEGEVKTLKVKMFEKRANLEAVLSYSIFPGSDAIARSVRLENKGKESVEIEKLASWSGDLGLGEWEMLQLSGDWVREGRKVRRPIYPGTQGFHSAAGYSSHFHNPFVAIVRPETTETSGPAYGFNLIYTGSHATEIEQSPHGFTRVLMGLNPLQLSWTLQPGESFTTPECVAVYSNKGIGGMSRAFHRLFRNHLSRSQWTSKPRPTLLNNWEATYFDFDGDSLVPIAQKASDFGVKLFVMDDGWFGGKHARTDDYRGLGDWFINKKKFPQGLKPFVDRVTAMQGGKMKFGIWVEPEMVNAKSELYEAHPDWILHATDHDRTEHRRQLILNLGLKEVQDYIIDMLSNLLRSADISYVKWDNNRMMHEIPSPSAVHKYMLGLYRVLDTLTTSFPNVLWEGCASGGGRFDAGILHYFPQTWTSDDTDAHERLAIQFGTTITYPASSMGCHVSAVPNHQTHRVTPFEFRAHVALMGGSFGFELDPNNLSAEEQKTIPDLIKLAERVNPLVINGEMYKLNLPEESNWPAAMYVSQDGNEAVVLAYSVRATMKQGLPALALQGLDPEASYKVEIKGKEKVYSGNTLLNIGLRLYWEGDYNSYVVFVTKQ